MSIKELIPDYDKEKYSFPVPEMPPVDNKMEPGTHKGNWLWRHYDSTNHSYRNEDTLEPLPAPLTDVVTPENPLKVDVFYSMRSPYSYLILQRITYLNSNYNVDVNVKVIFPVAVRTPGMFSGGVGGTEEGHAPGGRWYKWADTVHDTARVAKYEGIPYRFTDPDPIVQNHWPFENPNSGYILPLEEQPYIAWLVRLANAAQLAGKCLEFVNHASPLIWGGRSDFWPAEIEEAFNKTGLDYQATIKDIQQNPEKYDAVWQQNQVEFLASGHGGVPNSVFRGEPFFGQDRFDLLFWRLRQNGLTTRPEPRPPFTTRPLRWPTGY
jgi:2-hydroxychromene-2-carboxylate isomerase